MCRQRRAWHPDLAPGVMLSDPTKLGHRRRPGLSLKPPRPGFIPTYSSRLRHRTLLACIPWQRPPGHLSQPSLLPEGGVWHQRGLSQPALPPPCCCCHIGGFFSSRITPLHTAWTGCLCKTNLTADPGCVNPASNWCLPGTLSPRLCRAQKMSADCESCTPGLWEVRCPTSRAEEAAPRGVDLLVVPLGCRELEGQNNCKADTVARGNIARPGSPRKESACNQKRPRPDC